LTNTRRFTVIHTNDFHNKLTAEKAAAIRRLKMENETSTLLIDAGDAVSAGNITFHSTEPIYELMNGAGYNAMTLGNREFHFSRAGLQAKVRQAEFPVLCANLYSVSGDVPTVKSHELLEVGDCKVAVFGLTVPMITEKMKVRHASPFRFASPLKCASELVGELRRNEKPDVVILLSHCGLRTDKEIAQQVPGIDMIVGGHTHSVLDEGERVGDCLVVQAGSFARFVGMVDVELADGKLEFNAKLVDL
jgi:2',3'-cyclic-nucleotide 2'-phosphodiesterase (5'-nucleotidase family)